MLLVQTFLETRGLAALARDHGVYAGVAARAPYKASFNYDQIEAKESDLLARQCRGLVLARVDADGRPRPFPTDPEEPIGATRVLARPFDRFFNHGQNGTDAAKLLGRPGTRVFEKLDGTCCIVHHDEFDGAWHVATRSVPEADKPIDGFGEHTFRTLFEYALRDHLNLTLERLGAVLDRERTYIFELTAPQNRVVVAYDRPRVHLLAIRHRDGRETCPVEAVDACAPFSVPRAPQHACGTLAELIGVVGARSPSEREGVVVRAADFTRVKVKSPAYVAASTLRGSVAASPRRLLEVVLLGKADDVLPMLTPAVQALGAEYQARYARMVGSFDLTYNSLYASTLGAANQRKEIALLCQREGLWIPPVMDRFTGRCAGFVDWVAQRRDGTGGWPDAFLDNLLANLPPLTS